MKMQIGLIRTVNAIYIMTVCVLATGFLPPARAAENTTPADHTVAPAKLYVQVSVTDVEAQDGQPLVPFEATRVVPHEITPVSRPRALPGKANRRDDLSALKTAAAEAGILLTITPRFTVTTFDDTEGTVTEQTQIPYMTLPATPASTGTSVDFVTLRSSLAATPHVNTDGTVSLSFTLMESQIANPSWHELSPPQVTSVNTTTRRTFTDGDTIAFPYLPVGTNKPKRIIFLTVHVLKDTRQSILTQGREWQHRVAKVKVGMSRAVVENLLPRGGLSGPTDGGGSYQAQRYWLDAQWRVIVCYDYTGIVRDKTGIVLETAVPQNKIIEVPVLERADEPLYFRVN